MTNKLVTSCFFSLYGLDHLVCSNSELISETLRQDSLEEGSEPTPNLCLCNTTQAKKKSNDIDKDVNLQSQHLSSQMSPKRGYPLWLENYSAAEKLKSSLKQAFNVCLQFNTHTMPVIYYFLIVKALHLY